MARIELDNVSLTFQVRQKRRVTLKEFLVKGLFRRSVNPVMQIRALQDVNLKVREGDRLGIIGHNGAGKSTLLKVLAGIYPPTHGKRIVHGQISSLFDIALGFELDATGWENIAIRGYLQGETPKSIEAKTQPIAEFSELGKFLDMPVRYYSAGMMVRLAFSIATAIEPEILLVDEVLSVGDMAFQEKARKRIREMMAKARMIVLVSHDLDSLARLCDRGLWMDHGKVRGDGPCDEVIAAYKKSVQGDGAGRNGHIANGLSANGSLKHNSAPRPEWQRAGDLRASERNVYSWFGEDGILEEIVRRVGAPSKFFVEFTDEPGQARHNCARLAADAGWQGLFVEAGELELQCIAELCKNKPAVACVRGRVASDNVEQLLAAHQVPREFDVLSIMIAGNDYWVWQALERWRPRIVAIQYNAQRPPPQRWVMQENASYRWDGTDYYGASLASLAELGKRKGYTLVGSDSAGVNAYFVTNELATPGRFLDPAVQYYYSPPQYGPHLRGHPAGTGPFVEI